MSDMQISTINKRAKTLPAEYTKLIPQLQDANETRNTIIAHLNQKKYFVTKHSITDW